MCVFFVKVRVGVLLLWCRISLRSLARREGYQEKKKHGERGRESQLNFSVLLSWRQLAIDEEALPPLLVSQKII